jgi:WD40 repeat protein
MRNMLTDLGFSVTYGEDLGKEAFEAALDHFEDHAKVADIAMVYFSGHGATFDDKPYLVPSDATFDEIRQTQRNLIAIEDVLGRLRQAKGVRIALFDACRDNAAEQALKQRISGTKGLIHDRGLQRVSSADGLIVMYAAQHLQTAQDGETGHSPFAAALLSKLPTPGMDVTGLLADVARSVITATEGKQKPELVIDLFDKFTLVEAAAPLTQPAALPAEPTVGVFRVPDGADIVAQNSIGGPGTHLVPSVDGKLIALGAGSHVRLFDAQTGALLRTIETEGSIQAMVFANARSLLTVSGGSTLTEWDPLTGQSAGGATPDLSPRIVNGHKDRVRYIALLPDRNTMLVSTLEDPAIHLWNLRALETTQTLASEKAFGGYIAVSSDGRLALSAEKAVTVWNVETRLPVWTSDAPSRGYWRAEFSPDGRVIAALRIDGKIDLFDAANGASLHRANNEKSKFCTYLAFSPDSKALATCGNADEVQLIDVNSWQPLRAFKADHGEPFQDRVAFSIDGKTLFTTGSDGTVKVWDVDTAKLRRTMGGGHTPAASLSFSPDGSFFIWANGGRSATQWRADTFLPVRDFFDPVGYISRAAVSPDARSVLTGARGWYGLDSVILWDIATGTRLRTFDQSKIRGLIDLVFAPDGRAALLASDEYTLQIWNTATAFFEKSWWGHENTITKLANSPDGKSAVTGYSDGTLQLWNLASGELTATLSGHTASVLGVAFTSDSQMVLSGGMDGSVRLWSTHPGKVIKRFESAPAKVFTVSISPDGKTVIAGGVGGYVAVWDFETGQLLRTLQMPKTTATVLALAFSPNGKRIFAAGSDATLQVWDAETGRPLVRLFQNGSAWMALKPDLTYTGEGDLRSLVAIIREADVLPIDDFERMNRRNLENFRIE